MIFCLGKSIQWHVVDDLPLRDRRADAIILASGIIVPLVDGSSKTKTLQARMKLVEEYVCL